MFETETLYRVYLKGELWIHLFRWSRIEETGRRSRHCGACLQARSQKAL